MNNFLYISLFTIASLGVSGCVTTTVTDDENTSVKDYLLIQQQAEQAYKKKQYEIARKKYIQITRAVPKDADAWFRLGNIYARTHKPEVAIKAYKEAVLREPDLSKAWHNMGVVYMRQAANAYLSLQKYAEPDDPVLASALRRLNGLYELLPAQQAGASKNVDPVNTEETEITE